MRADPEPHWLAFVALSASLHVAAAAIALGPGRAHGPAYHPDAAVLAGDTLDVEPAPEPAPPAEPEEAAQSSEPAARTPPGPGRPASRFHEPRSAAAEGAESSSPPATPVRPSLFGAVGVRFATDLATTFTRAFPQTASADAAWQTAPFGTAGAAEVVLVLDDDGHLSTTLVEGNPSSALRQGIERTLGILRPRTFTAASRVTRLHVSARVSPDQVHDGLHGDVFALSGGSFAGDLGTAFFALPPSSGSQGRRVDVAVRFSP